MENESKGVTFKFTIPELPDTYEELMAIIDAPLQRKSLMVIKGGLVSFIASVFAHADEWAKENYPEYGCFIQNTKEGYHELILIPKDEQAPEQPEQ